MIVRTTKARMAEITTTLKGRAGSRDELAISKQGAVQLPGSAPLPPPLVPQIPSLHQPRPVMSDSQPLPQGHTFRPSHKNPWPSVSTVLSSDKVHPPGNRGN